MKSAKAGQTIYSCMTLEFLICDRLKCGYMSDHRSLLFRQSIFEHFHLIALSCLLLYLYVFFSFFSLLFAVALVANKVIIVAQQCSESEQETSSCGSQARQLG